MAWEIIGIGHLMAKGVKNTNQDARLVITIKMRVKDVPASRDAVDILRNEYNAQYLEEMEAEFQSEFQETVGDWADITSVKIEVAK